MSRIQVTENPLCIEQATSPGLVEVGKADSPLKRAVDDQADAIPDNIPSSQARSAAPLTKEFKSRISSRQPNCFSKLNILNNIAHLFFQLLAKLGNAHAKGVMANYKEAQDKAVADIVKNSKQHLDGLNRKGNKRTSTLRSNTQAMNGARQSGKAALCQVPKEMAEIDSKDTIKKSGIDKDYVKKNLSRHLHAAYATGGQGVHRVGDLVGSSGTYRAMSVDTSTHTVTSGQVRGTSDREDSRINGLHNIYVNVNESGQTTITTGVIESYEQAQEFVAVVKQLLDDGTVSPKDLRISMHQLNSNFKEADKIKGEHRAAAFIDRNVRALCNQSLSDAGKPPRTGPIVIHQNLSMNAAARTDLGGIKDREESLAKEINQEANAAYASWIAQDLDIDTTKLDMLLSTLTGLQADTVVPPDSEKLDQIDGKIEKELQKIDPKLMEGIDTTKKCIAELEGSSSPDARERLSQEKSALAKMQAKKQTLIDSGTGKLGDLQKKRAKLCNKLFSIPDETKAAIKDAKLALKAEMDSIQQKLSEKSKDSPTAKLWCKMQLGDCSNRQLLMMQFQLDKSLGVSSHMNCKSGLDRTGLGRSMKAALDSATRSETLRLLSTGVQTPEGKVGLVEEDLSAIEGALKQLDQAVSSSTQRVASGEITQDEADEEVKNLRKNFHEVKAEICAKYDGIAGDVSFEECLQHAVDSTMADFVGDFDQNMAKADLALAQLPTLIKEHPDMSLSKIMDKLEMPAGEKDSTLAAIDMQNRIFNELLLVALPVTGHSTGVEGTKYGQEGGGFARNHNPAMLIPRFVVMQNPDTGKSELLQLKQEASGAEGMRFTDAGNQIISGGSAARGG